MVALDCAAPLTGYVTAFARMKHCSILKSLASPFFHVGFLRSSDRWAHIRLIQQEVHQDLSSSGTDANRSACWNVGYSLRLSPFGHCLRLCKTLSVDKSSHVATSASCSNFITSGTAYWLCWNDRCRAPLIMAWSGVPEKHAILTSVSTEQPAFVSVKNGHFVVSYYMVLITLVGVHCGRGRKKRTAVCFADERNSFFFLYLIRSCSPVFFIFRNWRAGI